jgi:hypothetical protein
MDASADARSLQWHQIRIGAEPSYSECGRRSREGALLSSVRDVETGETHIFANLDQLNEWLRVVMNGPATPSVTPSPEVG